jgi:hypothetical protein
MGPDVECTGQSCWCTQGIARGEEARAATGTGETATCLAMSGLTDAVCRYPKQLPNNVVAKGKTKTI